MKNAIEPWGVNVPFIYSALLYWTLGAVQILLKGALHPLFMMDGSYLFYVGMLYRLFSPAKRYVLGHLTSLILLLTLNTILIGIGMLVVSITLTLAIFDVKRYGSKFPVNYLVILSPFSGAFSWLLFYFTNDYYYLEIPLLLYILGVNVGVFMATLNGRPLFGMKQLAIILPIFLGYVYPILINIITIIYPLFIIRVRTFRSKGSLTTLSATLALVSIVVSASLGLILGGLYFLHSFTVGVMSVLLFSCSTYALARYNYRFEWIISILLLLDLISFSGIPWILAVGMYVFLIRESLGIFGIKHGISSRFVKDQGGSL